MASGKSESSELAERFCLRGRFPGGPVAKSSAFAVQRSRGPAGRSGAEMGEVFEGGGGMGFGIDSCVACERNSATQKPCFPNSSLCPPVTSVYLR